MANWFTDLWKGSDKRSLIDSGDSLSGYADANEETFIRLLGLSNISVKVNHATAMGISTFFGCVRIITNLISSTPYGVLKKLEGGGSESASDHSLHYALSVRSNRHMSPIIAMKTLVSNAIVYGWSIARIVKTGSDFQYIPYPTQWVSILEDTDTGFLFFQVTERGRIFYLTEEEVIFLKDFSFDGKKGTSIVKWQSSTIKISLLTSGFLDKYYEKGTFAAGFLEQGTINVYDEEKMAAYKKAVIKSLKGQESGFGMAIIGAGGKWHPVARTPVESQLMETFNRSDREFARMFGIPLSVIGDTEKQTSWGTGVEQMFIGVTRSVLIPWAIQIEQEFRYKCFTKKEIKEGYYTKFNFWALLRGSSADYAAFIRSQISIGVMNIDEARALDEKAPVPGGLGQKHYMQGAMMPLDKLGQDKVSPTSTGNDNTHDNNSETNTGTPVSGSTDQ